MTELKTQMKLCSGCYTNCLSINFSKMKNGKECKTCDKCRLYIVKGILNSNTKRCVVFGKWKRSCSHCKRPLEYLQHSDTLNNKNLVLKELLNTI